MIRSYFGIAKNPFDNEHITLLLNQQEICDILKVHSWQGGFCLIMGEPGTGKTVIKENIVKNCDKTTVVITISRTMHTYSNILKIFCESFNTEQDGLYFKCEKRLINEALTLYRSGKKLIIIIDEAHLMPIETLRKLRLMFDDFPKNHNIILIGQPVLLNNMALKVNEDIKSRITYSTILRKVNPDDMESFILKELDYAGLGHNTFTQEAIALMVRSADGIIRKVRNLVLASLLEAVRNRKRTIDIDIVNRVLIQPHWRNEYDMENL